MRVRGGRQGSLLSKSQPKLWTSTRACGSPGMGPCSCAPRPLMFWTQEFPSSPALAVTTPGQPCLGSFLLLPPPAPTLPQAEPKSPLFSHQITALPTAPGTVQAASYCTLLYTCNVFIDMKWISYSRGQQNTHAVGVLLSPFHTRGTRRLGNLLKVTLLASGPFRASGPPRGPYVLILEPCDYAT